MSYSRQNLDQMRYTNYTDSPTNHDILPGSFSIAPLESLSQTERQEAACVHRHKCFEILFLTDGNAICRVDTDRQTLEAGQICLIRPGKMHAIEFIRAVKGYLLSFAPEFFPVSLERSLLLSTSSGFNSPGGYPLEVTGTVRNEMTRMMRLMDREYNDTGLFKAEVLRGLLKIFFIYLSRLTEKEPPVRLNRKNQIVEHFLAILDEKFATLRRPADYADALAVTTNYLNETLKTVSGFTTSYHIHQRVILEAKRLAVYGDHSMKQVASRLGFDDVCHFSRFFKKASGQGFTEFKQKTLIGVM